MFFYEWVAIKYNTCIIMPTISPFGLDGNNTNHSPPLTSRAKGRPRYSLSLINIPLSILPLNTYWNLWMSSPFVYAKVCQSIHVPSEYMLKSLFCWRVLFMLPLTVSKVCNKMFYKKNMTLYIINDLPITKDSIQTSITQPSGDHPPKQVGIHQKFTYDNQVHSSQA